MALNIKQLTNFSEEVINATRENNYIFLELGNVVRFGYICEEKGISYPIYLKMNNEYVEFNIGKTGIFEVLTEVGITDVKVPDNINFTIDYIVGEE